MDREKTPTAEAIKILHQAAFQIEIELGTSSLFVDHEGWNTVMSAVQYLREASGRDPANLEDQWSAQVKAWNEACDEADRDVSGLKTANFDAVAVAFKSPEMLYDQFTDHMIDLLNRNYPLPRTKKVGRA